MKALNTVLLANRKPTQPQLRSSVLLAALTLRGCSPQQAYNLLQENQRQRCELQPIPQQQACTDHYRTPVDEYQRVRESLGNEGDEVR